MISLYMLAEDGDQEKVGRVRKVASEPQGLHSLNSKETKAMHKSEATGYGPASGGPLALPPSVVAAVDNLEGSRTEHCEGSNGETSPSLFVFQTAVSTLKCLLWNCVS